MKKTKAGYFGIGWFWGAFDALEAVGFGGTGKGMVSVGKCAKVLDRAFRQKSRGRKK